MKTSHNSRSPKPSTSQKLGQTAKDNFFSPKCTNLHVLMSRRKKCPWKYKLEHLLNSDFCKQFLQRGKDHFLYIYIYIFWGLGLCSGTQIYGVPLRSLHRCSSGLVPSRESNQGPTFQAGVLTHDLRHTPIELP
jgi:hypothetical protein